MSRRCRLCPNMPVDWPWVALCQYHYTVAVLLFMREVEEGTERHGKARKIDELCNEMAEELPEIPPDMLTEIVRKAFIAIVVGHVKAYMHRHIDNEESLDTWERQLLHDETEGLGARIRDELRGCYEP